MHPVLASKERLLLYLAAWIPVGFTLAALLVSSGRSGWGEAALLAGPLALVYSFLCLASWYPCRSFPLGKDAWPRTLGVHAAGAIVSSAFWVLIAALLSAALARIPAFYPPGPRPAAQFPLIFGAGIVLYLASVLVHYMMALFERAREAESRRLQLEIQAREAELRALRAQIDPHFLFNCLHSIGALAKTDPGKARLMCERLGGFLRLSMGFGQRETVMLEEELELVSSYLDVERARLGPRLEVRIEIPDDARRCDVPPLILQPLVENAIRHGIAQLLEGGEIAVSAERRADRLLIRVENPSDCEQARPGSGIGLANVRSRLQTLYGREARLETQCRESRFTARVTLPAAVAAAVHER